jgi:hypothetical protein
MITTTTDHSFYYTQQYHPQNNCHLYYFTSLYVIVFYWIIYSHMIRQFISTETTGPFASIADSQKTLILFRFNFQYGHYKSCGCLRFSFDKLETITSKVDIFDLRSETDEESFLEDLVLVQSSPWFWRIYPHYVLTSLSPFNGTLQWRGLSREAANDNFIVWPWDRNHTQGKYSNHYIRDQIMGIRIKFGLIWSNVRRW